MYRYKKKNGVSCEPRALMYCGFSISLLTAAQSLLIFACSTSIKYVLLVN